MLTGQVVSDALSIFSANPVSDEIEAELDATVARVNNADVLERATVVYHSLSSLAEPKAAGSAVDDAVMFDAAMGSSSRWADRVPQSDPQSRWTNHRIIGRAAQRVGAKSRMRRVVRTPTMTCMRVGRLGVVHERHNKGA